MLSSLSDLGPEVPLENYRMGFGSLYVDNPLPNKTSNSLYMFSTYKYCIGKKKFSEVQMI